MNDRQVQKGVWGGRFEGIFHKIISLENLFSAWREFRRGKTGKIDVQAFELTLEDNIFQLHHELADKSWNPGPYSAFYVRDPKLRHIHKASVRDRVFHQALFRVLYPIFDKKFIHDSYSCRENKGVHKGVARLEQFISIVSNNYAHTAYALKCDIRKFFDSISHQTLFELIKIEIHEENLLEIIWRVIGSFETIPGRGLPLGNVTSQLFANIYLNELDQWTKHTLKIRHYIRYCDDFLIIDKDRRKLLELISDIQKFVEKNLQLTLHPNKVKIRKVSQGIDFLGYVALPRYRVLRTKTKQRMFRKIKELSDLRNNLLITESQFVQFLHSYYGILKHCKGYKIASKIIAITNSISLDGRDCGKIKM